MRPGTKATREELVKRCINALSKEWQCVQIMCSNNPGDHGYGPDSTENIMEGSGNWYARIALAQEFVDDWKRIKMADSIAEAMIEDKDDGDDDFETVGDF